MFCINFLYFLDFRVGDEIRDFFQGTLALTFFFGYTT